MPRFAVRHREGASPAAAAGAVAVGLALGALAGFVLGEIFGPRARRATRTPRPLPTDATPADRVRAAEAALAGDPLLAELGLTVLAVRGRGLELHGWAPSRQLRSRALRVVREAIPGLDVVDALLVRGEDDFAPLALADDSADERIA